MFLPNPRTDQGGAERDVWWGFVRGSNSPPVFLPPNCQHLYSYSVTHCSDLCVTHLLRVTVSVASVLVLNSAMAPIKTIEYFRVKPRWLFVKIVDDEDHVGWGEATLEGHSQAVEGTLNGYITRFVGLEAEDIEHIWQLAWRHSMSEKKHSSGSIVRYVR